ncbi:hypothetical protein B296_00005100 [Ensete ventricosum]|uniref:Uncharacterized protein n=1 Tax=Ensete ventricosum TaxID=4639 RepID=A0A426ZKB1_ENSVE|nr:hypothetical protein B296_00005100 [Ensete ventricosum]
MRLNHIELYYVFLLHFPSEGSEERGWPTTARPLQGRRQADRAASKGDRATSLQGAARAVGVGPVASTQRGGARSLSREVPPEGSDAYRRGNRLWARRPLDEGKTG